MPFPKTTADMEAWGYKALGMGTCKKCGAAIDWWETPKGKKMPTNRDTAVPHWENCENKGDSSVRTASVQGTKTNILAWLDNQASLCDCVVCKKLTGR